ncbi:MAG: DUF86 domain-containing protein [Thermomicrobiales bacterium]|nr:DUF86 domain-containing protein [Thermomicrobiales bacterium]
MDSDGDAIEALLDMLEFCDEITLFARGRDTERDEIERMRYLAIERLFELVGEALKRALAADPTLVAVIPDVSEIRGMRNRLVHEYDLIEYEIVWDAAANDIPALRSVISEVLRQRGAL